MYGSACNQSELVLNAIDQTKVNSESRSFAPRNSLTRPRLLISDRMAGSLHWLG